MSKLSQHKDFFEGWLAIGQLPTEEWSALLQVLDRVPPGADLPVVVATLPTTLPEETRTGLAVLFFGLAGLDLRTDFQHLAESIWAEVLVSMADVEQEVVQRTAERLQELAPHLSAFQLTERALGLMEEAGWLFEGARVVSDIRLVFNDHLDDENRLGLLVHQLRLTVQQGKKSKDVYISCSRSDLQLLKDQIDRALKKDQVIRKDYADRIRFIDPSI